MIPLIKKLTSVATTGLKGVKAALASTGIGALVVVLGLVLSNWKDISGAIGGAAKKQKEFTDEVKRTASETKNLEYANSQLDREIEEKVRQMKREGKSEVEIAEETLKAETEKMENAKTALDKAVNTLKKGLANEALPNRPNNLIGIEEIWEMGASFDNVNDALKDTGIIVSETSRGLKSHSEETQAAINRTVDAYNAYQKAVDDTRKAENNLWNTKHNGNSKPAKVLPFTVKDVSAEYDKIKQETEEYLAWYQNEYAKTGEKELEVIEYRLQKELDALDTAKEADKKAVTESKNEYVKNLDERLKDGEITRAQYNKATTEAETTLQATLLEIDKKYTDIAEQYRVNATNKANILIEQYIVKSLNNRKAELDDWYKSYEKRIYDMQSLEDLLLKFNKKNYDSVIESVFKDTFHYIEPDVKLQLNKKNTFWVFESGVSDSLDKELGEIVIKGEKTKEELEAQFTEFFRNAGQISESGWVEVRESTRNNFDLLVNDVQMAEDGLTGTITESLAKVTNAIITIGDHNTTSLYDLYDNTAESFKFFKRTVEDYYKLLNTPPKHISNYFDDDEAIAYYNNLMDNERTLFETRKKELENFIETGTNSLSGLTEGSEEYVQTQQMIADTVKEIDDLKTEHIINNLSLIDDREEKLKDNREKRWEWWMDNMAGVSSTLDNLGNIFQNELKREVEAGKISEEVAKDRFESLKALNYASVVMDTASAIMKVWKTSSDMPQPFGSIWGGIQTAALATQGILQLQQIKQQQFSASSPSTPGVTATPTQADYEPQYTANMTSNSELTELTNALNKRKLYVSVTDIEDTEKMVQARDSESTY